MPVLNMYYEYNIVKGNDSMNTPQARESSRKHFSSTKAERTWLSNFTDTANNVCDVFYLIFQLTLATKKI